MALTRKFLKGLGLSEEQIDSIVEAHTDTLTGLQDKIKALEGDAGKVRELQEKLDAYEKGGGEDWQGKYNQVKKDLEDYKAEVSAKESAEKVKAAYKALLGEEKIDPKRYDVILRATSFKDMKLDKDGKLENAEALKAAIREDWADFKVTEKTQGAGVGNPPNNGGGSGKTREEIMAIKDTGERQRAIAENHELFGF